MLLVYFNYPNSRISAHGDPACSRVQQMRKAGQRRVAINVTTFGTEIARVADGGYQFASTAALNDLWFEVDFEDHEFELAVAKFLQRITGRRYNRLLNVAVDLHCGLGAT